jgi:hypothetical protein
MTTNDTPTPSYIPSAESSDPVAGRCAVASGSARRVKLPPGWEKCRTGIKGVRKWRNMTTQSWVTVRADDKLTIHAGIRGEPVKLPSVFFTAQEAIDEIHMLSWSPNAKAQP